MSMTPYSAVKISGMWEVRFHGRAVATFFTETMAQAKAAAWNDNRQPRAAEIAAAISGRRAA